MNDFLSSNIKREGFHYDGGGSIACYLIHGFTGSTFEFVGFGKYLATHGVTAVADLLPGHGTSVEDCNSKTYRNWIEAIVSGYAQLRSECEEVFVGGFSIGTSLAIYLATNFDLPGLILYAPVIFRFKSRKTYLSPVSKWFKDYEPKAKVYEKEKPLPFFGYTVYPLRAAAEAVKLTKKVRPLLPQVKCPAIIMHSKADATAPFQNGPMVYNALGSDDKRFIPFAESSHMLTYDCEKQQVWKESLKFMEEHSKLLPELSDFSNTTFDRY